MATALGLYHMDVEMNLHGEVSSYTPLGSSHQPRTTARDGTTAGEASRLCSPEPASYPPTATPGEGSPVPETAEPQRGSHLPLRRSPLCVAVAGGHLLQGRLQVGDQRMDVSRSVCRVCRIASSSSTRTSPGDRDHRTRWPWVRPHSRELWEEPGVLGPCDVVGTHRGSPKEGAYGASDRCCRFQRRERDASGAHPPELDSACATPQNALDGWWK